MTEAEQNLREVYRKLGGKNSDIDWIHNCINKVALATLKDIRPCLEWAQQTAKSRCDDVEGEGYMSGAMYEVMEDTERLIKQIDLLIAVSEQ